MVNKSKVYKQVLMGWVHTFVCFFVMIVVMGIILGVSARFGGYQVVFGIVTVLGGISVLMFLLSEPLVTMIFKANKPNEATFPDFIRAVEEVRNNIGLIHQPKPRLYILEMGVPNAAAFGLGFLGQYGMGITKEIYDLLSYRELKAVVGHELAHIRCKDVGIMTVLTIITGGAEKLARLFTDGKTALGKTPIALVIGVIFYLFAKIVFPAGRSAISQVRELSADALSALYTDDPDALISALQKLSKAIDAEKPTTFLDDIFISHPHPDFRTEKLSELKN